MTSSTFGIAPLAALGLLLSGAAHAADGPVYLYVPLVGDGDFQLDDGSDPPLFVQKIGTLRDGDSLEDVRYSNFDVSSAPLPKDLPGSFDGFSYTVLGAVETVGPSGGIHMLTPLPGELPYDLQIAYLAASGGFSSFLTRTPFPTTGDIAREVASFLPPGSSLGYSDVKSYLFSPSSLGLGSYGTLSCGAGATCFADGDMFPHDPGDSIFEYGVEFAYRDSKGKYKHLASAASSYCLPVLIETSEKAINWDMMGSLPVLFPITTHFDGTAVTLDSVHAGSVDASCDVEDGGTKCTLSWPALKAAGLVTKTSTELRLDGAADEGDGEHCIYGYAPLSIFHTD